MTTPTTPQIPLWFIPSFHGDIKLSSTGPKSCQVEWSRTTKQEQEALSQLAITAKKKKWHDSPNFLATGVSKVLLKAPIATVAKGLSKAIKPGRTIIHAVTFKNGAIEELQGPEDYDPSKPSPAETASDGASSAADDKPDPEPAKEPKAAASVAAPTRGCPPPDFDAAEIKARAVLSFFLSPQQLSDFSRYNRFVSVGATTGNRYMVTSRQNRDQLALYSRTLYDLERKKPMCVHDWDVPPAEEMLSLHLLLQLPGWERYLDVAEDNMEQALSEFMGSRPEWGVRHEDPYADEVACGGVIAANIGRLVV